EAMLAMCEFDPQRAFDSCDTLTRSDDPWLRAAASFFRAAIGGVLGRMDEVEADCRLALDQFRVLGDAWGTAGSLVQLSEFAELRGEHQRALDFLEEAMACAQRLGAHTDMDQLGSKLVQIRVRMGDLAGAQAELDRARTVSASHPRSYDWSVLLTLMAAELAWKTGDRPAAIEACNKAIAIQASDNSPWRAGMRALVRARLAAILLEDDHDQNAAAGLLARALEEAAGWVERTTVAQIIDVIAALTARRGTAQDHERAALLLGAAHQVRGCFDEGSLDSLPVRDRAHRALGDEAFAAAYQRGRDLAYQDAISVAAESAGTRETGRPV
ncbi:MAG TPA: hypothetical protein VKU39_03220, partial [Streptosporangiaceae bacterium]|nr:hypothetical protein [Streptosporangiaceae bacterium]